MRKIIKIISVIVLISSLAVLAKLLIIDPYISNKTNDEIRDIYYSEESPIDETQDRFSSLLEINPDICGWVRINNTRIDYPVLQSSEDDPNYYLNHNYKKETTKYGSIFVDPNCKVAFGPKNTIMYGHHMNDGQMFADIMKFSDLDFYKKNPLISYDTRWGKGIWKIISVFKTNTLPEQGKIFQYVVSKFSSEAEFLNYVDQVKKRSLIDTGVDVNKDDKLITLSTCSYEFEGFRTVVVARKVRSGESENVDTEKAFKVSNPLMPACWYKKYGGSAPSQ